MPVAFCGAVFLLSLLGMSIDGISTFGFIGLIPFAPGTFGSLASLPVWYLIVSLGGLWPLLGAIVLLFGIGTWATGVETVGQANHDPGEIVIDEVVGQWITLLPLSLGFGSVTLLYALLGFALFRAFDILKPWPVSWADDMDTPLGVMLDDVIAGILAAIILAGLISMKGAFGV